MKDKIISLKTANLALEKGFKKSDLFGKGYTYYVGKNEMWTNVEGGVSGKEETTPVIKCTQSLLQRWLREKHEIHIIVEPMIKQYNSRIFKWGLFKSRWRNTCRSRNSYEEALEISLQKSLKLIKLN